MGVRGKNITTTQNKENEMADITINHKQSRIRCFVTGDTPAGEEWVKAFFGTDRSSAMTGIDFSDQVCEKATADGLKVEWNLT